MPRPGFDLKTQIGALGGGASTGGLLGFFEGFDGLLFVAQEGSDGVASSWLGIRRPRHPAPRLGSRLSRDSHRNIDQSIDPLEKRKTTIGLQALALDD